MARNEFRSRSFSPPGDFNARKIENPCEGMTNLVPGTQEFPFGSSHRYQLPTVFILNNAPYPPTNSFL